MSETSESEIDEEVMLKLYTGEIFDDPNFQAIDENERDIQPLHTESKKPLQTAHLSTHQPRGPTSDTPNHIGRYWQENDKKNKKHSKGNENKSNEKKEKVKGKNTEETKIQQDKTIKEKKSEENITTEKKKEKQIKEKSKENITTEKKKEKQTQQKNEEKNNEENDTTGKKKEKKTKKKSKEKITPEKKKDKHKKSEQNSTQNSKSQIDHHGQCYICFREDHAPGDCLEYRHNGTLFCANCGYSGHVVKDCLELTITEFGKAYFSSDPNQKDFVVAKLGFDPEVVRLDQKKRRGSFSHHRPAKRQKTNHLRKSI